MAMFRQVSSVDSLFSVAFNPSLSVNYLTTLPLIAILDKQWLSRQHEEEVDLAVLSELFQ